MTHKIHATVGELQIGECGQGYFWHIAVESGATVAGPFAVYDNARRRAIEHREFQARLSYLNDIMCAPIDDTITI